MRFRRGVRLLGSAALSLFLLGGLSACSGQQQEEEGLEVEQDGGGENQAANEEATDEGGGENQAAEGGEDNQAAEGGEENQAAEGGEDNQTAGNGNATENDLQEIIQEMNGQQTAGGEAGGDTGADAPQPDPAAAPAPVNTAQAAPAAPVEPAPAAPAAPESTALPFQPGGSPAAPGLPEIGSKMAYIVQHGDTLGKISAKIYGNGNRWQELATLSGIPNPSRIYPGDLVYYTLDESAVAFATAYEQVQRQEEQVKPGDTLATIAARVYGDSNAWRAIWRQNDKIDNPDIIPPGSTVYYVPKGALTAELKKVKEGLAKVAQTTNKTARKGDVTVTTKNDTATTTATVDTNNTVNAQSVSSLTLANGQSLNLGYSIDNVMPADTLAMN